MGGVILMIIATQDILGSRTEYVVKPAIKATYTGITPAMIGDFTGDSVKLFKDKNGRFVGALVTGIPTAQQIIGKARWLMRVSVSTANGAKTHREAERSCPVGVKLENKTEELGAIELAFGRIGEPSWKGLISLKVALPKPIVVIFPNPSTNIVDILENLRRYSPNYFYEKGEVWYELQEKRNNNIYKKYRVNVDKIKGSNRFNSLLAQGSMIVDETFIVAKKVGDKYYIIFPDPIEGNILSFSLEIQVDWKRLEYIVEKDKNKAISALKLAILSIVSTPILLGLGKAANRGFGRFKLTKYEVLNTPEFEELKLGTEFFNEPKLILSKLAEFSLSACNKDELEGASWESVKNSGVPRLPIWNEIDIDNRPILYILDLIAYATKKIIWKRKFKDFAKYTWLLGLPRSARKRINNRIIKIGYLRCSNRRDPRRQSILVAFTMNDGKIYIIIYPSGDILNIMNDLCIFYPYGKPEGVPKIRSLKDVLISLANYYKNIIKDRR